MLSALIRWLESLPTDALYVAIGVLAGLENIFPPVPADTAVALGGYLASHGRLSWPAVFGITWTANVASATLVYLAGWHIGRPFFRSRLGRRLLSERSLQAIERAYRQHGMWGIFLSRALPVWRGVVPPFAGIARLPAWRALPPMYLASGLWYGALTYGIYRLGGTLDNVLRALDRLNRGLAIAAALLAVIVVVVVLRVRQLRGSGGGA